MQIESRYEFQIKILIIGDSGVGKTNFIFQFTEGKFSSLHVTTVGFDFKTKIVKLPKSKKSVQLQIYDTAGQERYMALNKSLFQKVQGIIIMYDITNRTSYENLSIWFNAVNETISNKTIILVGNKLDLANEKRIITEEEGQKIANDNQILFFEASSCTGENVDNIFKLMGEKIYKRLMDEKSESSNTKINLNRKSNKGKKNCC